jgi:hypothetical protein
MAIGRISIKTGSKGKGRSHANYILRQDKYKTHSAKSEKLEHTSHGNMPQWANDDPSFFWKMADEHERKNGSVYREHILTLPRELTQEQRLELVKDWIRSEIGDKHPYTFAIHNPLALDGKEQPHCHLMFCERELDGIERGADTFFKRYNAKSPEKGGAKKANTGLDRDTRKQLLKEQRTRWGNLVNKHLERANAPQRVDMRNWRERGLSEKPLNISMGDFQDTHKRLDGMTVKDLYTKKLLLKRELEQALSTYDRLPVARDYTPPEKVKFTEPPQPKEPTQPTYANAKDEYNELRKTIANKLFKDDLVRLQQAGQPLLKQLDELAKNKPLLWGKKDWQVKHDKLMTEYNAIKQRHETIKKDGVSKYFDKARQQLEQTRPDLVQRVKDEYLAEVRADEQRRLEQYRANKATTAPKVSERELSDKARIGLQTIKNVIDAMPDGDKKTKAMAEFERTQATATNAQLEALAQVDVKVNKQTDVVIQAPSTDQDKGR